jgi:PAS domain S-box-containing protein
VRHVFSQAEALRDAAGRVVTVKGAAIDISERKRYELELRETRDYLKSLLDHANAPIATWSPDMVVTRFNHAFEALTGRDAGDVVGQALAVLFPEDSREASLRLIEETLAGRHWQSVEIPILRADGGVRVVLWSSANIYSADGETLVATIAQGQDISARKQAEHGLREAERELAAMNLGLERRVLERTLELEAANRELEAFSYSVSHDLRAPLRALDGFSLALIEDYGEQLDDTAMDYLARVRGASQRMGQLIDDLLMLSQVTRREMDHERVDLSALARDTIADLREAQPERVVHTHVQDGLSADGDPALLRVVLQNLLVNAWKFTSRMPEAHVEVGVEQCEGDAAYFVRDDGAGFDAAYVGKLFTPFQRLHGADEFPGTGIGLATVKRIVQRHGGTVWAVGAVDCGATFYFTLD